MPQVDPRCKIPFPKKHPLLLPPGCSWPRENPKHRGPSKAKCERHLNVTERGDDLKSCHVNDQLWASRAGMRGRIPRAGGKSSSRRHGATWWDQLGAWHHIKCQLKWTIWVLTTLWRERTGYGAWQLWVTELSRSNYPSQNWKKVWYWIKQPVPTRGCGPGSCLPGKRSRLRRSSSPKRQMLWKFIFHKHS